MEDPEDNGIEIDKAFKGFQLLLNLTLCGERIVCQSEVGWELSRFVQQLERELIGKAPHQMDKGAKTDFNLEAFAVRLNHLVSRQLDITREQNDALAVG